MMEMLGTWALVYFGGLLYQNTHNKIGLSYTGYAAFNGVTYMCFVYMAAQISGSHFNPVVSFAMLITGHIGIMKMLWYWIAQFSGSF